MPRIVHHLSKSFTVLAVAALLASCGGGEDDGGSAIVSSDCPPVAKGSGVFVGSRVNIDDAMKYTFWLKDYPPKRCAGKLADLIPDLPAGYGLAPTSLTKPPIMGDDHIAFALGELPDELINENDMANFPMDTKRIDYEIVRFTPDERATMDAWFASNPDSYLTKTFEGQDIYLAGALATMRPGKAGRVGTGIVVPLKENLLLRMSYTDMLTDLKGKDAPIPAIQGNPALELLSEILSRAKSADLL
jgi:hypothetical protein